MPSDSFKERAIACGRALDLVTSAQRLAGQRLLNREQGVNDRIGGLRVVRMKVRSYA